MRPPQWPRSSVESTGSPKFLGNPHGSFAVLSDPGRPASPRPFSGRLCCPRFGYDGGASIVRFEALSHRFRVRCVRFAGWIDPPQRNTRFRVLVRLSRTGLITCRAPIEGFRSYISFPFSKLGLARIRMQIPVGPSSWQQSAMTEELSRFAAHAIQPLVLEPVEQVLLGVELTPPTDHLDS